MLSRIKGAAELIPERHSESITTRTFTRIVTRAARLQRRMLVSCGSSTVYKPNAAEKAIAARQISANIIHGSDPKGGLEDGATEFFTERRTYGVPRWQQRLMPAWDRMAQSLIVLSRAQPRVFPEMAFRTMALFLKMLMVVRVAETKMLLLPGQAAHNMENVVGTGKWEAEQKSGVKQTSESSSSSGSSADSEGKSS